MKKNNIDIEFICDRDIVARVWLSRRFDTEKERDFANYLWEKHNNAYRILKKYPLNNQVDLAILGEIKSQPFFNTIMADAEAGRGEIASNFESIRAAFEELLFKKLRFDKEIPKGKCFCVPRRFFCGFSLGEKGENVFIFGHPDGASDKNYDAVYVLHEALHSVLGGDPFDHSLLQLIADFEAGIALRRKPYLGHKELQGTMAKMLPYWNLFLNRDKGEIKKICELFGQEYSVADFEKHREQLSKMKFSEFYDWLKQNCVIKGKDQELQ